MQSASKYGISGRPKDGADRHPQAKSARAAVEVPCGSDYPCCGRAVESTHSGWRVLPDGAPRPQDLAGQEQAAVGSPSPWHRWTPIPAQPGEDLHLQGPMSQGPARQVSRAAALSGCRVREEPENAPGPFLRAIRRPMYLGQVSTMA